MALNEIEQAALEVGLLADSVGRNLYLDEIGRNSALWSTGEVAAFFQGRERALREVVGILERIQGGPGEPSRAAETAGQMRDQIDRKGGVL